MLQSNARYFKNPKIQIQIRSKISVVLFYHHISEENSSENILS